ARVPDGDGAVRAGAERADAAVPERLRRKAGALRRQLHGYGVQRATPDRARLRVRAGDEAARPPGVDALTHGRGERRRWMTSTRSRATSMPAFPFRPPGTPIPR